MKSLLHISSFVRVADVDGEEDAADEDHRDDVGDDSEENIVEVLGVDECRSLLLDGREVALCYLTVRESPRFEIF